MIDPILANTALIFAKAIFYCYDRVSILMAKQIYIGIPYNLITYSIAKLYDY